jgi:hypothetical protein
MCVIHKEGLCPSSGDINRLMMMMIYNRMCIACLPIIIVNTTRSPICGVNEIYFTTSPSVQCNK